MIGLDNKYWMLIGLYFIYMNFSHLSFDLKEERKDLVLWRQKQRLHPLTHAIAYLKLIQKLRKLHCWLSEPFALWATNCVHYCFISFCWLLLVWLRVNWIGQFVQGVRIANLILTPWRVSDTPSYLVSFSAMQWARGMVQWLNKFAIVGK